MKEAGSDEEEVQEKPKKEKNAGDDEEEEEEQEEDEDGNTPFVFEGVEYLRTEDGDIVDPENFDLMGEDDDGQGGIDWSDEDMMKKHEEKKGK